ncbi:hypothetical protein IFM89_027552 [Coptis chinensis]|uniref:C2H2-type domain-containing protein n=1 Tax=Coptis chinensis TaxID=261450 RepID=A0A835LNQ3_9MAGN|nr:hypothetical protein IFM89_027552 [Coptis chinensis]
MAMALDDEQPTFKHFCKVCKKGFGCGRALGGHMRAHGIGDESYGNIDDDEHSSDDWEDKLNGNAPASNKRMYALRTNPNRLKSCRICANCGKEFSSWKSFLEHGKCRADDVESLVSSPRSKDEDEARRRECGWFKGKRTRRASVGSLNLNCPSSEEEDLANCLVMLSSARVDPVVEEVVEESCASASREEDRRYLQIAPIAHYSDKGKGAKGMFECKACKKSFNSHQALGGHRASHKKVKGCFAAKLDGVDEGLIDEDVITNDEFSFRSRSTAIALGGHKRCHWITSNSPDTSTIAKFHPFKDQSQFLQAPIFSQSDALDLNVPASTNDTTIKHQDLENPLGLEISTAICLQSWAGVYMNENKSSNDYNNTTTATTHFKYMDEEVDSEVKLAKLNGLKDLHMSSDSSPWLQVGIGSTSNVFASRE